MTFSTEKLLTRLDEIINEIALDIGAAHQEGADREMYVGMQLAAMELSAIRARVAAHDKLVEALAELESAVWGGYRGDITAAVKKALAAAKEAE